MLSVEGNNIKQAVWTQAVNEEIAKMPEAIEEIFGRLYLHIQDHFNNQKHLEVLRILRKY